MKCNKHKKQKELNSYHTTFQNTDEVNEEKIRSIYQKSEDVKVVLHKFTDEQQEINTIFIYCENLVDKKQINQFIIPQLKKMTTKNYYKIFKEGVEWNQDDLEWTPLKVETGLNSISLEIFDGNLVIYFPDFVFFFLSVHPINQTVQLNNPITRYLFVAQEIISQRISQQILH